MPGSRRELLDSERLLVAAAEQGPRVSWNKRQLAKELGISRSNLIMKVERYGLDKKS